MEIGMRLPLGEALSYESPRLKLVIFRVIIVHKFFFIVADAKLRKFFDYANSFKEFVYRILMLIII